MSGSASQKNFSGITPQILLWLGIFSGVVALVSLRLISDFTIAADQIAALSIIGSLVLISMEKEFQTARLHHPQRISP